MRGMTSVSVSALSQLAQLANSWMLTGSPQAEAALLRALAEDVRAPSFGGAGRKAVSRGLKRLAWRFEGALRLTPGEQETRPVLQAVVQEADGGWRRVGYVAVGQQPGGTVHYLDYREGGLDQQPGPSPAPRMVGLPEQRISEPADSGARSVVG